MTFDIKTKVTLNILISTTSQFSSSRREDKITINILIYVTLGIKDKATINILQNVVNVECIRLLICVYSSFQTIINMEYIHMQDRSHKDHTRICPLIGTMATNSQNIRLESGSFPLIFVFYRKEKLISNYKALRLYL